MPSQNNSHLLKTVLPAGTKPQRKMDIPMFVLICFIGKSIGQLNNGSTRRSRSVDLTAETPYFFYQQTTFPKDCAEVFDQCSDQGVNGVYLIKPDSYTEAFEVYCDNGGSGGWTVIQRRDGGFVNFNRTSNDYKNGFGFLGSEFWLGNEKIAALTNQRKYLLQLDITISEGTSFDISYDNFRISDDSSNFVLVSLGRYIGSINNPFRSCPTNMTYNSSCSCQTTCDDPHRCDRFCMEDQRVCVCDEGLLLKDHQCVPPRQCACFIEGDGVIPKGAVIVNLNCSSNCICNGSGFTCDYQYHCGEHATCEDRNGVRKCYCNRGYIGDGEECRMATECYEIFTSGFTENGVYMIYPTGSPKPFEVYCNMSSGGGWTVFQRRVDGIVDFYRDWDNYTNGFGLLTHEFWLGNENIFYLTNQRRTFELRIDLVNRYGSPFYATYTIFRIHDAKDDYRLVDLGSYRGNAGRDSLSYHRHRLFSTYDNDNDADNYGNCAAIRHSGWWYSNSHCDYCDLNGDYNGTRFSCGFNWDYLPQSQCALQYSEMKVRSL